MDDIKKDKSEHRKFLKGNEWTPKQRAILQQRTDGVINTIERVRPRPGSRRCQIETTEHMGIRMTRDRRNWLHAEAERQNVSVSMLIAHLVDLVRLSADDHK